MNISGQPTKIAQPLEVFKYFLERLESIFCLILFAKKMFFFHHHLEYLGDGFKDF